MSTIYVVTAYEHNHTAPGVPVDSRLLDRDHDYRFFVVDRRLPPQLAALNTLQESVVAPHLAMPGKKYLAEWTFFLAEYEKAFCSYPFFVISSRFYEKNRALRTNLSIEWETIFTLLRRYGWGYLPSYDRPGLFVSPEITPALQPYTFVTEYGWKVAADILGIDAAGTTNNSALDLAYRGQPDFGCNYIGFATREHLTQYVEFYLPLLQHCFTETWEPRFNLSALVNNTGTYRNEKPFTFLLECFCHYFFWRERKPFFVMNYDGYHEIEEYTRRTRYLAPLTNQLRNGFRLEYTTEEYKVVQKAAREPLQPTERPALILPVRNGFSNFLLREKLERLVSVPVCLDLSSRLGSLWCDDAKAFGSWLGIDGGDYDELPTSDSLWRRCAGQWVNADPFRPLDILNVKTGQEASFSVIAATCSAPRLTAEDIAGLLFNVSRYLALGGILLLWIEPVHRACTEQYLSRLGFILDRDAMQFLSLDFPIPLGVTSHAEGFIVRRSSSHPLPQPISQAVEKQTLMASGVNCLRHIAAAHSESDRAIALELAMSYFSRVQQIEPVHIDAIIGLAICAEVCGQIQEAYKLFEAAAAALGGRAEVLARQHELFASASG
jgi:hypothetical protein